MAVTRWRSRPDTTARAPDGGLDVTFRLSLPPSTPGESTIRITGDRPAIGTSGTVMAPVEGNPWLYEATVHFGHDGPLNYRYSIDGTDLTSKEFSVTTDYDGQEVDEWVALWTGTDSLDQPTIPVARDEWMSGVYPPDFWQPSFRPESGSVFAAALDDNANWVAISSVWSFGRIRPDPVIESRPLLTWTVLTPIDDIRDQARLAHDLGLKVFLAPQQNPEVQTDWREETSRAGTPEWWDR